MRVALLLVAPPLVAACATAPAERPADITLPSASTSPPPPPPPPTPSSTARAQPAGPPAPPPDSPWKRRCAASIKQGLAAAANLEPALRTAVVDTDDGDEVSVSNPLGFYIGVRRNRPDAATKNPTGTWGHRAESLRGSYHVMFIKDAGEVSAALAFDGWPSPVVQPLVPVLQAAIDRCFPPR